MLKPFIIITITFFAFKTAVAQKAFVVCYLKTSGFSVSTIDSADFILTIFPPDSTMDKDLFLVKNYYANGKIRYLSGTKIAGLHSTEPDFPRFLAPTLDGSFISFFPNGHKMQIGSYENGVPVGDETEYYPNGKLYCTKTYTRDKKLLCNECRDSIGSILVENGNGKWLTFDDEKFKSYLVGDVINGLEQGEWRGKRDDTTNSFGVYKNGELKSAGIFDRANQKIYTKYDSNPEFPGGLDGFYHFLGRTIRYPAKARERNTQGRVVITFIVDESGSLGNFFVARSVSREIDAEAMRVLALSPKWNPGLIEGKPVRVMYGVPINFTLSSDR